MPSWRSMLLLALLVCLGHFFIVENPGSSVIGAYPRLQWLIWVLKKQGIPATCPSLNTLPCTMLGMCHWGASAVLSIRCIFKLSGFDIGAMDVPNEPSCGAPHPRSGSLTKASLQGPTARLHTNLRKFTLTSGDVNDTKDRSC